VVAYAAQVPAVTGRPDGSSLPRPGWLDVRTGENSDRKRCPVSWLRAPCGLRPAPSAQTTSSARGLGGWSRKRGPAVSPAQTGLRSPVVCGTLAFALLPLALAAPTHPSSCAYRTHPQSCPPLSGCKRLHLSCGPSWAVRSSGRVTTRIVSSTGGSGGLTHPRSCPPLSGCKRLHLSCGPSWVAGSSGRVTTRIVRCGRWSGGVS